MTKPFNQLLPFNFTSITSDGLIYGDTLNMNFAGAETLDPRITFSRTSNATLTNSAGVLTYAPNNLLTFSEQFDNAAWTLVSATVTANVVAAPDGTTTAETLAVSSGGYIRRDIAGFGTGAGTVSFYVRKPSSSGANAVRLTTNNTSAWDTGLSTKVTLTSSWQRISLSGNLISTGTAVRVILGAVNASGTNDPDCVGNVEIWGAQLNVGALQPYYPTTVKNLLGYTQEFDNAAWTKSNSFVQTNQIRNNTMQGAVAGTPGTTPTNWSIVSGGGISRQIVSTGTEAGISYIDVRFFGTGSSVAAQRVYLESTATVPAATGQSWALSAYVKLVSGTSPAGLFIGFDETGPGTTYIKTDQTSLSVTDALLRYVYSAALTGGANVAFILPQIGFNSAVGVAVDFTLRIGLPQLVQGASAGDVVATYGTARAVMYTAPDGSLTADKLVENTVNNEHYARQTVTVAAGTRVTFSYYIRAAERRSIRLRVLDAAAPTNGFFGSTDASTGLTAQGTTGTGVISSVVSQNIGGGWYRLAVSGIASSTATTLICDAFLLSGDQLSAATYTGDGTSGIFIWGAQVSDSASLDPYVYNPVAAPASTAYYGPRFDYDPVTLAPKGLLIEEQRTNLVLQSEAINESIWNKGGATVSTNTAISPDGTQDADRLVEDTGTAVHYAWQNFTPANATTYTWSVYLKAAERSFAFVGFSLGSLATTFVSVNLATGAISTAVGTPLSFAATSVGNGWWRVSLSLASTGTTGSTFDIRISTDGVWANRTYTGDGTSGIYIWGAQLEAGAFPTSYIPTTTAAATRAADVATMIGANFSNWYNQTTGSAYIEGATYSTSATACGISIDDTTNNNRIQLRRSFSGPSSGLRMVSSGGSIDAPLVSGTLLGVNRIAVGATASDQAAASNGALFTGITSITPMPTVTQMQIGNGPGSTIWNGTIKRIAFYPRRLANSELQSITA